MRRIFLLFIFFLEIGILITCKKDELNPSINYVTYTGKSGEIGFAGGEIKITDSNSDIYGASITIPEGALSITQKINIEYTFNLKINGSRIKVIEFGPEGLHFNKPVKIGVPISGGNNSNVVVYNYNADENTFQELSLIENDQQNNIAYANTEHFSLFVAASENLDLPGNLGTISDPRDGHQYKWVKIGEQIWMAENLAYLPEVNPDTVQSSTEPLYYVYNYSGTNVNDAIATDNYYTYGVLYNWPAAKTACPDGWHLPTDDEWEQLAQYVSDQKGPFIKDDEFGEWSNVGWYLNASPNGSDDFSFSAIPGGYLLSGWNYQSIGGESFWWSATELYNFPDFYYLSPSSYNAWHRRLKIEYSNFYRLYNRKNDGESVRCVKGEHEIYTSKPTIETKEATNVKLSSATISGFTFSIGTTTISERGFYWSKTNNIPTISDNMEIVCGTTGSYNITISGLEPGTKYYYAAYATNQNGTSVGNVKTFTTEQEGTLETFTDSRDGHEYKWVKIGDQIWMAENLAYLPEISPPSIESDTKPNYYVNYYFGTNLFEAISTDHYNIYGVLYNFTAANTACPTGWHLPTNDEWELLAQYVSDQKGPYSRNEYEWSDLGKHLKASGRLNYVNGELYSNGLWFYNDNASEGTDDFGFSALPGGSFDGGSPFYGINDRGCWWSATHGNNRTLLWSDNDFHTGGSADFVGNSVRCIKD